MRKEDGTQTGGPTRGPMLLVVVLGLGMSLGVLYVAGTDGRYVLRHVGQLTAPDVTMHAAVTVHNSYIERNN